MWPGPLLVSGRLGQGKELAGLDHLGPGREEPGGDDENLVHLLVQEGRGDGGGDGPGVLEGGTLGESGERRLQLDVPETEEGLGLAARR